MTPTNPHPERKPSARALLEAARRWMTEKGKAPRFRDMEMVLGYSESAVKDLARKLHANYYALVKDGVIYPDQHPLRDRITTRPMTDADRERLDGYPPPKDLPWQPFTQTDHLVLAWQKSARAAVAPSWVMPDDENEVFTGVEAAPGTIRDRPKEPEPPKFYVPAMAKPKPVFEIPEEELPKKSGPKRRTQGQPTPVCETCKGSGYVGGGSYGLTCDCTTGEVANRNGLAEIAGIKRDPREVA